jgi:tRNA(Ile)-lysidine synthase
MTDRLEETVAEFIRRHELFAGADRVLLAISGGADSIALLHIFMALKAQGYIEVDLVCGHINHQLRGPASDADEQFVVAQANRLGLPVVTRAVEVQAHARTHRLSLETAARQLRLASLAEIARSRECTWIGTGHQKNDNAETVLHRLLRGTGFRGLAGIWPMRRFDNLWLASPLLCATRAEIDQYLRRRDLPWREDATNVDVAYRRNYIRHRLLPLLQQDAHGCLVEELSELATTTRRLYIRIEREADEAWSRLVKSAAGDIILDASGLASLPEPVAIELIRKAVVGLGGDSDWASPHYRSILQLARKSMGGKRASLPGGLTARRERAQIILSTEEPARVCRVGRVPKRGLSRLGSPLAPPTSGPIVLAVPGKTQFAGQVIEARILQRNEVDTAKLSGDKSPSIEYFDLDRVKPPVTVRTRKAGDRFQPLGMAGEKKVGKFLTTAKVPRDLRERILILADRERIIWVCPVRTSEQARITESTHHVLQLTIRDP